MILYHGSEHIIEKPRYNGGKPNNDYGRGFYCTEYADMAREWSVTREHNGYVNQYELDTEGLKVLNLNDYPVMTWLAVLLENRTFNVGSVLAKEALQYITKEFSVPYQKYDVITGYRADDSYFSFAYDFINGVISYEQLSEAMKLGKLGNQIVLKSKKSFEKIEWVKAEQVSKEMWYPKKEKRDSEARKAYVSEDKMRYVKGALYITKVLDEEIKKDDPRIR